MPPVEPRPARSSLLPEDNAQALVIRGVEAIEGNRAQLAAVEKSLDGVRAVLADSQRQSVLVETALARLAAVEEERVKLQREDAARREAWAARLWGTPAVQLLIMALVLGAMQLAGLRWAVEHAMGATQLPERVDSKP